MSLNGYSILECDSIRLGMLRAVPRKDVSQDGSFHGVGCMVMPRVLVCHVPMSYATCPCRMPRATTAACHLSGADVSREDIKAALDGFGVEFIDFKRGVDVLLYSRCAHCTHCQCCAAACRTTAQSQSQRIHLRRCESHRLSQQRLTVPRHWGTAL